MLEALGPELLSRIQFAFTVSFHITFPAFTIDGSEPGTPCTPKSTACG